MSEILGVVEILESLVADASRVPFTRKIVLDQKKVFELVDKIKYLSRDHSGTARTLIDRGQQNDGDYDPAKESAVQLILDAKKESADIKKEANQYTDAVLGRMQLLVTKLQKNLMRLEKNISDGRMSLEETYQIVEEDEEV